MRAIEQPEAFVWAILPHAARTFSSCIVMLPKDKALAAAVGYMYCRALDTYEDLSREPTAALDAFAQRFSVEPKPLTPNDLPALEPVQVQDDRDRAHLLLVERLAQVDTVYGRLMPAHRSGIARCVREMAQGMKRRHCDASEDVLSYCRSVIGNPTVFALELLLDRHLTLDEHETAMQVGELVQIANITRDIEKDLDRGVCYDARLRACNDREAIETVRRDLMTTALHRGEAYRRMMAMMQCPRWQLGRAAALLMLMFTNRYYDECARQVGYCGWSATRRTWRLFASVAPAVLSHGYAMRKAKQVESAWSRFALSPS
ncbi:MAG: squalene/phytoene synthase family protein [Candidatus Latescibacterota bacterium]|nr:squalene/phytoene synthase family protein [Candidatus Latescibacterota bacterium]